MIEEDFLPPCTKCSPDSCFTDVGVMCRLHYALLFLHYLTGELAMKESRQRDNIPYSAVENLLNDNTIFRAEPGGRQLQSTAKLFSIVKDRWWRAAHKDVLWYGPSEPKKETTPKKKPRKL